MDVARITITLLDVEPGVRRVIEVPLATTLRPSPDHPGRHGVAQPPSLRVSRRAHCLRRAKPGMGRSDHRVTPAAKTPLADLLSAANKRILYIYDMGDDWQHRLDIVRPEADNAIAYPRLIKAQGRCPPEDVGGAPGFDHFIDPPPKQWTPRISS